MTLPTEQSVSSAYQKAPQYVKNFMDGEDLTAAFKSMRATYNMHVDDAGVFAQLMDAVMLELIPLGQFEAALAEHIPNLKQEERTKLTREVNEKVFAALRKHASEPPPATPEASQDKVPTPPPTLEATEGKPPIPSAAIQIAQTPVQSVAQITTPATNLPSVVVQKLSAPISEIPKAVTVAIPTPEPKPTVNPKYSSGADPYREPIE